MASERILSMTLDEIINFKRKSPPGKNNSLRGRLGKKRSFQRPGQVRDVRRLPLAGRISKKPDTRKFNASSSLQHRLGKPMKQIRTPIARRSNNDFPQRRFDRENIREDRNSFDFRTKAHQGLERRGIRTKNNLDPFHVLINGAIVRGLRSDQLLLQKLRQQRLNSAKGKLGKIHVLRAYHNARQQALEDLEEPRRPRPTRPSNVRLNFNRALTVNIQNEAAHQRRKALEARRRRSPVMALRRRASPISESEESFDEEMEESEEEIEKIYVRKPIKASQMPQSRHRLETPPAKTYPQVINHYEIPPERPPPPKPHRQILDQQIQKEIATLQGKAFDSSSLVESGPGPGVKGFKMLPSKTKHSLNERFTLEAK